MSSTNKTKNTDENGGDVYYAAGEDAVAPQPGTPTVANDATSSGGVRIDGDAFDDVSNLTREGHLFCWFACDMRRAVIITNAINITLAVLEIVFPRAFPWTMDGDLAVEGPVSIGRAIASNLPRIILSGFGILGALKFTYWQVFLVALWHSTDAFLSVISWDIPGIVTGIVFAYPHIVFASQLNKGIMKPETYEIREKQSCCCV